MTDTKNRRLDHPLISWNREVSIVGGLKTKEMYIFGTLSHFYESFEQRIHG